MTIRVLDPRLDPEGEPLALAPAVASLEGATIALLDNTKIGTASFYSHLETLLRAHGVREIVNRRRPSARAVSSMVRMASRTRASSVPSVSEQ